MTRSSAVFRLLRASSNAFRHHVSSCVGATTFSAGWTSLATGGWTTAGSTATGWTTTGSTAGSPTSEAGGSLVTIGMITMVGGADGGSTFGETGSTIPTGFGELTDSFVNVIVLCTLFWRARSCR